MLNRLGLVFLLISYKCFNAYTCSSDTNCVVDCVSTSCRYTTIDGKNALSLTVKCRSDSECDYANIKCPSKSNGNLLECNIDCNRDGCSYINITYNEYTSLNLECKNYEACRYITLKAASSLENLKPLGNIANITCLISANIYSYSYGPCYSGNFDLTRFGNVTVNCISNFTSDSSGYSFPCYDAVFNASTSNILNINCHGHHACYYTDYYCPSHDKNVCNVDCQGSYACHYTDIYTNDDFAPDFVSYECGSGSYSCSYANYIKCGSQSTQITLSSSSSPHKYSCDNGYCCPWSYKKHTCAANSTCIIDCTKEPHKCRKKVINAKEAKSLIVYCGYSTSYSCEYALIHCPDNGGDCDIQCTNSRSCYSTYIYGFTTDNINLNCTHQWGSCGYLYLFANYSNNVNINCESSATKSSSYTSCSSMTIYGDNIKNKLTYRGIGDYSGSFMYFYLRHANNVELTFTGVNSGYSTYVYTDYANKTTITCHAKDEDLTCTGMSIYYKPSSNILNLKCQGYGCKDLNIKASDSQSPSWNNFNVDINGCGVCNSISSCITSWDISCDDTYYFYHDSLRFYGNSSCSKTECNCNSIYKSVEYTDEGICNLSSTTTAEAIKESNISLSKFIVGIIILFSILCVMMTYIGLYGYKRLNKKQLNEIDKIMKENLKSDTQNNNNNNYDNNAVTSGIQGNETSVKFNPHFVINEALVENNSSIKDVNNVNDVNIAGNEYVQLNQDN